MKKLELKVIKEESGNVSFKIDAEDGFTNPEIIGIFYLAIYQVSTEALSNQKTVENA